MDAKEHAILNDLHALVRTRRFHERDVLALLILLRLHAPAGSAVRELGDFIAHREKDRGLLKSALDRLKAFVQGSGERTLTVQPILTASALCASLNRIFGTSGLALFDDTDADDILVAAMCLLQDVQLVDASAPFGRLLLARTASELMLLGVVRLADKQPRPVEAAIPLIIVHRASPGIPPGDTPVPFNGIVEAKCVDGVVALFTGAVRAG